MTTPSDTPEISRLRRGKSRARLPAERHFSHREPGVQNLVEKARVLRRIDAVLATGENGQRTGRNTGAMRGSVDAARQPGCGGKSRFTELARQPLGDFDACGSGIARADDRDQRHRQDAGVTADREQGRRVVDHLQPNGIVRLAECDEPDAEFGASSSRSASSRE
jgi:hypothetical protein